MSGETSTHEITDLRNITVDVNVREGASRTTVVLDVKGR